MKRVINDVLPTGGKMRVSKEGKLRWVVVTCSMRTALFSEEYQSAVSTVSRQFFYFLGGQAVALGGILELLERVAVAS